VETISVSHPSGSYPIFLGEDILADAGKFLQKAGFSGACAVVTNPTVGEIYAETALESLQASGFQPALCQIPDGEEHKTLDTVASLYGQFLSAGLERRSPIISLGGGVVGDIPALRRQLICAAPPLCKSPLRSWRWLTPAWAVKPALIFRRVKIWWAPSNSRRW